MTIGLHGQINKALMGRNEADTTSENNAAVGT
jgi:hypothetical protein